MGQYHYVANLDKKEYIHPHVLGDGLKLMEFGCSAFGTMTATALLLACSNGRGGGDWREDNGDVVGRWAGDRIAIIGDYAKDGDFPGFKADSSDNPWADEAGDEYLNDVNDPTKWVNISQKVRDFMQQDDFVAQHMEASW